MLAGTSEQSSAVGSSTPGFEARRWLNGAIGSLIAICGILLLVWGTPALAQEKDSAAAAEAAKTMELLDPEMSTADFGLRLVHMTRGELEEFTKAWIKVSQAKTKEAAELNIQLSAAQGGQVATLRSSLDSALRRRYYLFERLEIVLDAWEAKGAKPETLTEYRSYIAAVRKSERKSTDSVTQAKLFFEWVVSSEGGGQIGVRLLSILAALVAVMFVAKILTGFVKRALYKVPEMSGLLRNFISKIAYWLILAVGMIFALSLFGINMTPLMAVFGGASFIIGFAMQSTLGNLASGLLLMITKPFDVGDVVEAAGVSGTVQNVSIVSTTILTFDNQVIVVPNTMVWDSVITNVNASDIRRVDLLFGIAYGDDVELAMKTLQDVISEHPLVLKDPEPNIRLHELADSSVNFICRPWAKTEDYWTVYWDILPTVKERFEKAGLSIPFPQQDVHIHKVQPDEGK